MYMYPDNLKSKATLWLWELRDIGIIGVGCLISVFALSQLGWLPPIVLTALYAFLSIRFEDVSILDFIRYAAAFFFLFIFMPSIHRTVACQRRKRRHSG